MRYGEKFCIICGIPSYKGSNANLVIENNGNRPVPSEFMLENIFICERCVKAIRKHFNESYNYTED